MNLPYRSNVGALLRRGQGADTMLLMAERIHNPGSWQFPQGGVKRGEDMLLALWRELEEELGLSPVEQLCRVVGHGPEVCYDFPLDSTIRMARKYRGQAQVLYLLDYLGTDDDFDLTADKHPEFRALRWATPQEAVALLWDVKRPVLVQTLEALAHHFQ